MYACMHACIACLLACLLVCLFVRTFHYITLHYVTFHYVTLHYIYITLHTITLQTITLHYIHTYIRTIYIYIRIYVCVCVDCVLCIYIYLALCAFYASVHVHNYHIMTIKFIALRKHSIFSGMPTLYDYSVTATSVSIIPGGHPKNHWNEPDQMVWSAWMVSVRRWISPSFWSISASTYGVNNWEMIGIAGHHFRGKIGN
jgi:hypothetical protein